jgi:hypothetical protein
MAEIWDIELEEDVFVLFSSTLAVATGFLCLQVQLHLLLVYREYQRRGEGARAVQQYRPPLLVPVGPPFSLDLFTEEYCVQFFRLVFSNFFMILQLTRDKLYPRKYPNDAAIFCA